MLKCLNVKNHSPISRAFLPVCLLVAAALAIPSRAGQQKLTQEEATKCIAATKDGKSNALAPKYGPLLEKAVAADLWSGMHAQIFQNKQATFLLKNKTAYNIGAGTETVYANGSGGPYALILADLDDDHVIDLVFFDKVVLSGVYYDHLRMFDGKRNITVDGDTFMCKNVSLNKDKTGRVTATVDGKTFKISVAPSEKAPGKSVLKLTAAADEK